MYRRPRPSAAQQEKDERTHATWNSLYRARAVTPKPLRWTDDLEQRRRDVADAIHSGEIR
jgi:hypothetical protein